MVNKKQKATRECQPEISNLRALIAPIEDTELTLNIGWAGRCSFHSIRSIIFRKTILTTYLDSELASLLGHTASRGKWLAAIWLTDTAGFTQVWQLCICFTPLCHAKPNHVDVQSAEYQAESGLNIPRYFVQILKHSIKLKNKSARYSRWSPHLEKRHGRITQVSRKKSTRLIFSLPD